MSLSDEMRKRIDEMIASDEVVLFMKGNRTFPQCGFSATVVQILNSMLPQYTTVNVLTDPEVRQGIKVYSDWPTIPQLYIRGEFVGGCDIIRQMHASGELAQMVGASVAEVEPPTIEVTPSAADAIKAALAEADAGDIVHLTIDAAFNHQLDLGQPSGGVQVEAAGVTFQLDPVSAGRASGLRIGFVDGPQGTGFKLDNPNRPAEVVQLPPAEIKAKLDAGEIRELFDVRTDKERAIASVDGARPFDDAAMEYILGLPKDTPIAFMCHHGARSQTAAEHFREKGFTRLYNVSGGIDAWAQSVDPKLARY